MAYSAKTLRDIAAGRAPASADKTQVVAFTDSTGGTGSDTLAAGVGISQIAFDLNLAAGPPAGTSAGDVVTAFVPGFKFKLLALDFITSVAGVGSSASQVFNLEIGTTNVTAGTLTLTEASTATVGALTAGAAITGANTGTASDTFSVEMAASGTAFTAGAGTLLVTIQNMDTADAFASISDKVAEYDAVLENLLVTN